MSSPDGQAASWLELVEQSPGLTAIEICFASERWGWLLAAKSSKQHFKSVEKEVLGGIVEIVVEHLNAKSAIRNADCVEHERRLNTFKLNAHRSLEPKLAANLIVNDARWLCGCERVAILTVARAGKLKLAAVSSIATLDRKSDFCMKLESLARLAVEANVPMTSDRIGGIGTEENEKEKKLQRAILNWQQKHGFGFLFGLPLVDRVDQTAVGFLVFEAKDSIDRPNFARALRQVEPHAALAIANVNRMNSIPFRQTLRWIGRRAKLPWIFKAALVVTALAALIAVMVYVDRPFSVRTHGELLPRVDQQVCAQIEGNLGSVAVEHGQVIRQGQLLATIENSDLEADFDGVVGEYAKTKQLVESKKILLGQYGHSGDQALVGRLAAEISDLGFQLELLDNRRKYLLHKKEKLNVRAPRDGQIITWQTKSKLLGKPVRWGDNLFSVADLDGPWDVVLRVPENRVGYILDCGRNLRRKETVAGSGQQLPGTTVGSLRSVEFFLKSDPSKRYEAEIVEVSSAVEVDDSLGKLTTIRCTVPAELVNRRHGATIVADIDCGDRPLWFVCFGEFFDGVRRRWVW